MGRRLRQDGRRMVRRGSQVGGGVRKCGKGVVHVVRIEAVYGDHR